MRIAVDGRVLHGPGTGTAVYTRGLLDALVSEDRVERLAVATYADDPRGPAPVGDLLAAGADVRRLGRFRSRLPGLAARTGLHVPFDVLLPGADWYVYPNFRWLPVCRGRTVTVVHDLAACAHPWSVPDTYRNEVTTYTRQALWQSSLVVTPSETVAAELHEHFPRSEAVILAVRPGPRVGFGGESADLVRQEASRRGVLFVGTVQPRKNIGPLLAAHAGLPDAVRWEHPLTIVGQRGWERPELFERLHHRRPQVTVKGYVDDRTLREAYARAAVLVAPSWYEGFDLPVLEAMAAGVPVVCSNIPVHREVAGSAARYFPPDDAEALADELVRLLVEPEAWREASTAGRQRSADFDWSVSTSRLLDVLGRTS